MCSVWWQRWLQVRFLKMLAKSNASDRQSDQAINEHELDKYKLMKPRNKQCQKPE